MVFAVRFSFSFFQQIKYFLIKLNFGPQHPAAHGVLRLVLLLRGEFLKRVDVQIGLLHRGSEKLMESRNFLQNLPYFDRFDYVSMMAQEHTYSLCLESAFKLYVPLRAQLLRILCLEITRLLNHLLALTTHIMDVGATTPFLWGFEEREKLLEFYERLSGARMHANFIVPGGLDADVPLLFFSDFFLFLKLFLSRLFELDFLITQNRIWVSRLNGIGVTSVNFCKMFGFSGVQLRSGGLCWDLRKTFPYEVYDCVKFLIPVGLHGDCYDRFLLRLEEMYQSVFILFWCLSFMQAGSFKNISNVSFGAFIDTSSLSMESVIQHFLLYSSSVAQGSSSLVYFGTEAPKGEFGVFLAANSGNFPYRCHVRSPGIFHLFGIELLAKNLLISDLVTIIGSQDLVLGEIDR